MGTRAIIRIEGIDFAVLYKHWDGYPEATEQWLRDFNAEFTTKRGDDPEYKFAQLVRSSAFDAEKYRLDTSRQTGWGIMPITKDEKLDLGQEFEYILCSNGNVKILDIVKGKWSSRKMGKTYESKEKRAALKVESK